MSKGIPKTYIKIIRDWVASGGPDVFCTYDPETNKMYIGLTLVGFVPKDAEIIGVFDEKTDTLTLDCENSTEVRKP
jgi:hypothetical protein